MSQYREARGEGGRHGMAGGGAVRIHIFIKVVVLAQFMAPQNNYNSNSKVH